MTWWSGSAMASIDIEEMERLVRGMENVAECLPGIREEFDATLDRFRMARDDTARMGEVWVWASEMLPQLRRRLALARDIENQRPGWASGTVQIDEAKVISKSPAEARQAGVDAAAALRDASGVPDPELLARISAMSDDPYFAAGFAATLPPEELAAVLLRLADTHAELSSPSSYRGNLQEHEQWFAEATAWYEPLLESVSRTIGTATFNTGDLALPSGYARSWIRAITAEPTSERGVPGRSVLDQAGVLGQVLGAGGRFEDSFILGVAEGVYDYERAFAAEHGGSVWAPRSSVADSRTAPASHGAPGAPRPVLADPLQGIMAALGRSPAAAQQFFSRGGHSTIDVKGVDVSVGDRLQYLVAERSWSGMTADSGAALGAALEAATTTYRDRGEAGRTSARLAGETFALIGERTGQGDSWHTFGTEGWETPTGMRVHVGHMLQSYGADVLRVASRDRADTDATRGHVAWRDDLSTGVYALDRDRMFAEGEMPYGVLFDVDHLKSIVGTLGERPEDFKPVLVGVFQASNLAIYTNLKGAASTSLSEAAHAFSLGDLGSSSPSIQSSAEAVAGVMRMGRSGAEADEAARAAERALIADALGFASQAPFLPTIKNEWTKLAYGEFKSWGLGEVRKAPETASSQLADEGNEMRSALEQAVIEQLVRNHYLSDKAQGATAFDGGLPPETAILKDEYGEPIGVDFASPEFWDWYNNSPFRTAIRDKVVTVYQVELDRQ